ncbi:pseudaminic acid synthase [Candidatus Omnitrophus magneticus]|uniref:Pseudaminic acid synthase n=1 Tax=Candidatus Omnitrophus magneticus TaxID=1609969 RepID=A0A0F0CMC7_9BACT|nr:pseudaminic acid synthase [Candidatus Omnitrophus magneticus]
MSKRSFPVEYLSLLYSWGTAFCWGRAGNLIFLLRSFYKMNFFLSRKNCFIAAEISANHGGSLKRALSLINKAKECGADGVKFQTYTPDTLTINCDNKYFKIKHPKWGGQTLYELYKDAYTPWAWFKKLKKRADDLGLVFFSTCYDNTSVDFLEELRVPFHKIASFELVDIPLIEYMAKTGKPIILSTGMADLMEIKLAVDSARLSGAKEIALLKCVSGYPASPEEMNLKTIIDMKKRFNLPVGLSDHTLGIGVALAAIPFGIFMIEKHFTLSRGDKSADSFFSMEPSEFKALIDNARIAENALGEIKYGLNEKEKASRIFRRSLFVIADMKKGEKFTIDNVRSIRPSNGLSPAEFKNIIGRQSKAAIKRGTPLTRGMVGR